MSRAMTALAIVWAAAHQVQTGYHISALNGIQAAILCRAPVDSAPWRILPSWMLPYIGTLNGCVPMKSSRFGVVVALFTAGSLLGSMVAAQITPIIGRVGTLRLSSFLVLLGSLFLAISNTTNDMVFSRILVGIGSGFSTVTVPLYLTELAPSLRNNLGILNQLAMVLGLIIAQSLAILFARQYAWRYILIIASLLAALLLVVSIFIREPSAGVEPPPEDEETSLLPQEEIVHLSITELIKSKDKEIRRGFRVIVATQIAQQICGISPVIYFSSSILRRVFSTNVGLVAIGILLIKFPASLLTIPILPRTGSRRLLVICSAVMTVAHCVLALGLNLDKPVLAAVAIVAFILAFGIGTGPVTWVVLSEVMPPEGRTAAGSLGLSLNAMTSFVVSSLFLPIQDLLMTGEDSGEGNVFFVFALFCFASLVGIHRTFKRYDRIHQG